MNKTHPYQSFFFAKRSTLFAWGLMLATAAPFAKAADVTFQVSAAQGAHGITNTLQRVRELRQSSTPPTGPVHVILAPGEYVFEQPLTLGPADSGTAEAPLVLEAKQPGTVRLVGARRLKLSDSNQRAWRFAPSPSLDRDAERSGGQFYVNERRAVLAREPNLGNYWLVAKPDNDALITSPQDTDGFGRMIGSDKDRGIVVLMQSWTSGEHRVASFDATTSRIALTPKPKSSYLKFGASQRYFLENVLGAWDAPGEWIGAEGALQYHPTPADGDGTAAASRAVAYWPRQPLLLALQGSPATPIHHVQIRGLGFAYSGNPTPAGGWVDNQAAVQLNGAIEMSYASDILLTECKISHVGAYAIWMKQGVQNSEVSHCVLDDLGAGGIKVGTERVNNSLEKTGGNRITSNVIQHTGRQFPGAIGIWIGRSFDNDISANIIAHTSYTGISVGWSWGYEDPTSGNNKIVDNVLLDIGQGMLSDVGAIYTLGRSPGTVISGNYIRHVEDYGGYGPGGWGIYNDEGSSDMLVENNVVIGTHSGGYQLHYGRNIDVRNNLFAQGRVTEVRWANVKKSGDWKFENNSIEARQDRKGLAVFNNDGATAAATLNNLQSALGSDAVKVITENGLLSVRLAGGDESRLLRWRQVIDKAKKLVDEAKKSGIEGIDVVEP